MKFKAFYKALILQWIVIIPLYAFFWAWASFAEFELLNPFQWIIDIPTYFPDGRALVFSLVSIFITARILFAYNSAKNSNNN